MGKNSKKKESEGGLVYSTGGVSASFLGDSEKHAVPSEQLLYVSIDRKQRKGKEVTLIEGFRGAETGLINLAKTIKNKCGTGGSVKDGELIIQGNFRDKIITMLEASGYKVKRKGA